MTVKDLKKRLENIDEDKMILLVENGGWTNINLSEKDNAVHITPDRNEIFSDDINPLDRDYGGNDVRNWFENKRLY